MGKITVIKTLKQFKKALESRDVQVEQSFSLAHGRLALLAKIVILTLW